MTYTIRYLDETMLLEDRPADVGYAAEKVAVRTKSGEVVEIGGMVRGVTQILISLPNLGEPFVKMAQAIRNEVTKPEGVQLWVIINRFGPEAAAFKEDGVMKLAEDFEGEFGGMYGVKIADGLLEGALTAGLFVISKDGTLFYRDVPREIPGAFNHDRFLKEANKAVNVYNGQGCHG